MTREAVPEDLDSIVSLYGAYMFDSYLVNFGPLFVKRYLEIILNSKNCVTLVTGARRPVGFIMAALDAKKILAELLLDTGVFRAWMNQALVRPGRALQSLELLSYPLRARRRNINAELLFIALDPAYRGQGHAARLIDSVLRRMRSKGVRRVKVTTLAANTAVNRLLAKLGFELKKTFRLFGRPMHLYDLTLD